MKKFGYMGLVWLIGGMGLSAQEVTLKEKVVLQGASIYGRDVLSGPIPEAIGKLFVAKAPAPGAKSVVSASALQKALQGAAWPEGVVPPSLHDVLVYRQSADLSQESLQKLLNEAMVTAYGPGSWKLMLTQAQWRVPMAIEPPHPPKIEQLEYDPTYHRFTAVVVVYDDEGCPTYHPLQGRLVPLQEIPVLVTPLRAGEPIQAHHITLQQMPSDRLPPNTILDQAQLIGLTAKSRTLQPHQPLRAHELTQPLVIRQGSLVSVVVQTPHMQLIQRKAKALEDGVLGQSIRVQNLESNRTLVATVKGPDVVEVHLVSLSS